MAPPALCSPGAADQESASKQSRHSDGSDAVATNRKSLAPQEGETEQDVRLLQHQ